MNKELVTRILIQLEPSLAQEFGLAIAEDEKKLKALDIIKENNVNTALIKSSKKVIFYNLRVPDYYNLTEEKFDLLKEVLL